MKRVLSQTLFAALALGGMAATAQAQTVIVRSLPAEEAASLRSAIAASMEAASRGERVGMVTGKANPQAKMSRNGGVSQELDASTLMFSVARINADGQVEMVCVNSLEAANSVAKAPTFAKRISLAPKE